MKTNIISHILYGTLPHNCLPRAKAQSQSRAIPQPKVLAYLYILAALLLLLCTVHIASAQQQVAMNFGARDRVAALREPAMVASLERRVFDLVNKERVQNGLRPLVWVDQIAFVARYHSTNMATTNFFAHMDPQGRRSGQRADQNGVSDWKQIGENIAWLSGSDDPAARVVRCWMESPGHRANILESKYRESGIGLAMAPDGKYYFTQVFVLRK